MTETTAPAHEIIWSLTNAAVPSACLHLIADTGVADHLGEPSTAADLAQRCSLDPVALDRVLRLLGCPTACSIGTGRSTGTTMNPGCCARTILGPCAHSPA